MTRDDVRADLARWADRQHSDGVREDGSTNDGEPMRRYALPKETPAPWCARMVRAGLIEVGALRVGDDGNVRPHDLYEMGSARLMYAWLLNHGAMKVTADDVTPGDLRFLLGRGGSDPLADGTGIHHVGVVVEHREVAGPIEIVDGNWADRVSLNVERAEDPRSLILRWPVIKR